MKWQDAVKYGGGTSVSVILAITLILNMTGMEHSIPQDQYCTDCFEQIQVNSTIWEIKVEHAGDKDIIFAKVMSSRTRWLNLDKINNFVPTNPEVPVEILVPTIKKYAEITHPKYGYLRSLKDGDTLIARKNKNNPTGDVFYIHGQTSGKTIKWGIDLDSWTMDGIYIDPVWYANDSVSLMMYLNGLNASRNYELGTTALINVTSNCTTYDSCARVCLDIDQPNYGTNTTCIVKQTSTSIDIYNNTNPFNVNVYNTQNETRYLQLPLYSKTYNITITVSGI